MKTLRLYFLGACALSFTVPCEAAPQQDKIAVSKKKRKAVTRQDEETITSLMDILNGHLKMPDNVSQKNMVIAGTSILLSLVTYYGTNTILNLPVIGNVLRTLTASVVQPDDLIQGLSLVAGMCGGLCLYSNANDLRKKFISSFASILFAKQIAMPHVAASREVWDSALQGFALLHLVNTVQDAVIEPAVKKIRRALKKAVREAREEAQENRE